MLVLSAAAIFAAVSGEQDRPFFIAETVAFDNPACAASVRLVIFCLASSVTRVILHSRMVFTSFERVFAFVFQI
jgi:hypothetical protein